MQTPIKLYLDKVYNNGSNGETFDSAKIYYNFEKIDKIWFERFLDSLSENNASAIMLPAGRFIAIISLTFERKEHGMILMDLHNDKSFAKDIASKREPRERKWLMETFALIAEKYQEDFNKFVLVEGPLPI